MAHLLQAVPTGDVDQQMQADVDAHAGGQQVPDPQAMMQQMMQQMLQNMMQQMQMMFAQNVSGASPGAQPGAPQTHWHNDRSMSNVKLDERAFRRIKELRNKKENWTEWRDQVLVAIGECDKSFADYLVNTVEKMERPITDLDLDMTQRQLSAALYARLVSFTSGEAAAIVKAGDMQGVESWRQLLQTFNPQTDARFVMLLIAVVSFKISAKECVQSGLIK